jgi:NTP pyrophosphatase (non-canonical NTP hydrolase)
MSTELDELRQRVRQFARARDWEQFHSPKNLAMALAGECGEVLEHFQWLTQTQSTTLDDETRAEVAHELADVFIYTVRLSDVLGVDLMDAAFDKIKINDARYPADRVRGDARRAGAYDTNDEETSQ